LLSILDEARAAFNEWTPDVDVKMQLQARYSNKMSVS
jgi:hypothetical protein